MIEIKIDTGSVEKLFKQLSARTSNTRPAMLEIAQTLQESVEKNFEVGGRPKWQPLSQARINQRSKKHSRGPGKPTKATWPGQILRDLGLLEDSISSRATNDTAIVGAFTDYALAMQLGVSGSQSIPTHKNAGGSTVKAHTRQMNIPARPFLVIQPEDMKEAEAILMRHLLK